MRAPCRRRLRAYCSRMSTVPRRGPSPEALALVPGGIDPPPGIPPQIFGAALATVLELRRLDMRALAGELGIARATLYRKAGARDHVLGQVVWYLTRRALVRAAEGSRELQGVPRVVHVVQRFMADVHSRPALRRLLAGEPEIALRVLTSKHGPVQRGVVETLRHVLDEEEARGTLRLNIQAATLAYAIVRIGESFLYADVIADNDPDVSQAVEVIERLLHGSSAPIGRGS